MAYSTSTSSESTASYGNGGSQSYQLFQVRPYQRPNQFSDYSRQQRFHYPRPRHSNQDYGDRIDYRYRIRVEKRRYGVAA